MISAAGGGGPCRRRCRHRLDVSGDRGSGLSNGGRRSAPPASNGARSWRTCHAGNKGGHQAWETEPSLEFLRVLKQAAPPWVRPYRRVRLRGDGQIIRPDVKQAMSTLCRCVRVLGPGSAHGGPRSSSASFRRVASSPSFCQEGFLSLRNWARAARAFSFCPSWWRLMARKAWSAGRTSERGRAC